MHELSVLPFLGLIDLYTQRLFVADDVVVRCCKCGRYALRASWETLGRCALLGCSGVDFWTADEQAFRTPLGVENATGIQLMNMEESEGMYPVSGAPIVIQVSAEPDSRYTRISQLGWSVDLLGNAYALVVGAGALGNEVLKNLALVGWGHIFVVDMDAIEESNLTRSVLFRKSDVGPESYKAKVAADRVRDLNPDVQVLPVIGSVQESLGLGVFRRMDVVFGCLDNQQARLDVSRACWQTLTPYIDAALDGISGDVQIFVPPYTACYGCTMTSAERKAASQRDPCLKVKLSGPKPVIPTAPTISAMMAGWQTQIGIKHLHGRPIPAGQRIMIFGESDVCEWYGLTPSTKCPDHELSSILQDGEIVELPCRAETTTLRDLARILQQELAMGPETTIRFDFDVLLTGECPQCKITKEFYCRRSALYDRDIVCPNCHSTYRLDLQYEFDGTESYADRTLASLGVPPLHILMARNWPRRLYRRVELTGDFSEFFHAQRAHNPKLLRVSVSLDDRPALSEALPLRLPMKEVLRWRTKDWYDAGVPNPAKLRLINVTQGFAYKSSDTLLGTGTRLDDLLRVEAAEVAHEETPPPAIEIKSEDFGNG